jgi:transcriptional regulator with XRE-family HTH domain
MSTHQDSAAARVPKWTVAWRLLMAREDAGLSQKELHDLTGISVRTISTYEDHRHTGRRNPIYVNAIADACAVDREWIWNGTINLREHPEAASTLHVSPSTWNEESAGQLTILTYLVPESSDLALAAA